MAYSGQGAPGLIEPMSKDDGVSESGPDGNNTRQRWRSLQMAKMVMYNLRAINGETDGNGVLPENDSPETKMEE